MLLVKCCPNKGKLKKNPNLPHKMYLKLLTIYKMVFPTKKAVFLQIQFQRSNSRKIVTKAPNFDAESSCLGEYRFIQVVLLF